MRDEPFAHKSERPCPKIYLNMRRLIILFLITLVVERPLSAEEPAWEQTTLSSEAGFSLSYPADFVTRPAPYPQVALALAHPTNGFPTINVVVQPGEYGIGDTLSQQKRRLINSYRQVGFLDAQIEQATLVTSGSDTLCFRAEVIYHSAEVAFGATVYIIPSSDRYFILTGISRRNSAKELNQLMFEVFATFSVTDRAESYNELSSDHSKTKEFPGILWAVACLVILLTILFAIKRKRATQIK